MTRAIWIVPCFNEAARLPREEFLRLVRSGSTSLIFVDDGSTDDTASVLVELAAAEPAKIRVYSLDANSGKGEAVRQGMRLALEEGADAIGFTDADLATPVEELLRIEGVLFASLASAAIGSRVRLLGSSIDRTPIRHYLGRSFATAASLVLRVPVYDTQCGAKLFRNDSALESALSEPFHSRWAFDVELLGRLLADGGSSYRIVEVPIASWRDVGGSKVRPQDFVRAGFDLVTIERALARRRSAR